MISLPKGEREMRPEDMKKKTETAETLPEEALEDVSGGRLHLHGEHANDGGAPGGPPIIPEIDPGK